MSLQFLGQKSWHPASKANQKRVWVAEQRAKEREEREREKAKEVRKAAEALQAQQAAAAAGTPAQRDAPPVSRSTSCTRRLRGCQRPRTRLSTRSRRRAGG